MSDILTSVLTADAADFSGFEQAQQWGIFKDGEPVVVADSVNAFGYMQDWPISTYPVEEGGFETYDKVQLPFEQRVRFVTGGDREDRQALLDSIEAIAGDLNLYDVVTPEKVYLSCNVIHCDYERNEGRGAGLIRVNVYLMEVRVAASAQYNSATPVSNAKDPGSNDQVNNGTVQPQTPNQRVQQGFSDFGGAGT